MQDEVRANSEKAQKCADNSEHSPDVIETAAIIEGVEEDEIAPFAPAEEEEKKESSDFASSKTPSQLGEGEAETVEELDDRFAMVTGKEPMLARSRTSF